MTEADLNLVVVERLDAAEDVVSLTLADASGDPLPSWEPGAHIDITVGDGTTRQYSLCGSPDDRSVYRIGVLNEPAGRGGSVWVHDALKVGAALSGRGPRNHFPLHQSPRYLFVAGGIGITPILAMIGAVQKAGAEWTLVYGGRRSASMAFLDEISDIGSRATIWPQDTHGLIDLPGLLSEPRDDTLVYCCGPEPLLVAVEKLCAPWPSGALHLERFSPKDVGAPVRSDSFEVVLTDSGVTLTVPPDRTILEVVEAAGVNVLSSCGEGTCGTCETGVVDGEPDHRDSVLTPEEQADNSCMMICVSRSVSPRLVLEL
ncbi:ferredoxin [Rhodococcoides trifolii]|uniref:Ferredoxin n=1 Tax=Rhodococcoides trifolii TaxID=908250 RepID=A0A917FZU9_9NOCA|nr:PDR/VanB family oxidoreductase [Rhodococcus trifolii]GGG15833.1 ferredoxin [Rhodococcus trifolii]